MEKNEKVRSHPDGQLRILRYDYSAVYSVATDVCGASACGIEMEGGHFDRNKHRFHIILIDYTQLSFITSLYWKKQSNRRLFPGTAYLWGVQ